MKKLIAISLILLAGCIHWSEAQPTKPSYYDDCTANQLFQTQFNEEQYIWETFIFSTNRVDEL